MIDNDRKKKKWEKKERRKELEKEIDFFYCLVKRESKKKILN